MEFMHIQGSKKLFVLFHGTGGNEESLLDIAAEMDSKASIISFLGTVGNGKMRRFFAPLIEGKVDRDDLEERVEVFLEKWESLKLKEQYDEIILIGYSNGANFILSLLEKNPDIASSTILLHPSELGWKLNKKAKNNRIIITLGANDRIAPPGNIVKMVKRIKEKHYFEVELILLDTGHEITHEEIKMIKEIV